MRPDIEDVVLRTGLVDRVQLRNARGYQRRWGRTLEQALIDMRLVSERDLVAAVAALSGAEFVVIGDRDVPREVLRRIPARLAHARRVVPLALVTPRRGPLVVAMEDPADLRILDELAFATGVEVKPVLAGPGDLERALARLYPSER